MVSIIAVRRLCQDRDADITLGTDSHSARLQRAAGDTTSAPRHATVRRVASSPGSAMQRRAELSTDHGTEYALPKRDLCDSLCT